RPRPPTLPPRQPSEIPGEAERSALKPETRPPNGASGYGQHRSAGGKVTRGSSGGGRSSRRGRGAFELREDALAHEAAGETSRRGRSSRTSCRLPLALCGYPQNDEPRRRGGSLVAAGSRGRGSWDGTLSRWGPLLARWTKAEKAEARGGGPGPG
ncbi:unnamed protein product, partial [Gulo gulo]